MKLVQRFAAPALGLLFLFAGALKSIDALAPIQATAAYDVLPAWAAFAFGAVLPALEVVLGGALLLGTHRRPAAVLSAILGGLFAIANISALSRGLLVDCGCFGGLFGTAPLASLALDAAIVALAVVIARKP